MNVFEIVARVFVNTYGAPIALLFGISVTIRAWDILQHMRSKRKNNDAATALVFGLAIVMVAIGVIVTTIVDFIVSNVTIIALLIGGAFVTIGALGLIRWWFINVYLLKSETL